MEKVVERIRIATLSELPRNLGKTVSVGPYEIALFHLGNGEIRAIENRCPHKGGVLAEGIISGEHVFCPMHDWKINVSDGNVQAPDTGCVKTFEVEVDRDEVFIILNP
ncbi:nitrite reductase small subunit NirD [Pseudalkalibacillus salsuginis]|uniref:nitrite reductase small subunit NirD n=1 Tax=Pseudalkalibacillus salsuginis TaxID=2910972 RepID=UPI001F3DE624|nr:nitrite reductase small subunit NirD [Pseudalkalibacillus salsuginis]MCF6411318.1 nitrite reductase small subunit NirD [Pseudalkalibacillus salsuginis]